MTNLSTRAAQPGDVPSLIEMICGLAAHHGDTATIDAETLENAAFGQRPMIALLVAEIEGTVAGYCALCPLAQLQFGALGLDMHHLYVQPFARQRGVAQALIKAAIVHAGRLGCSYLMVGTHPDNIKAQALYRSSGFADASPSGPRFIMRLNG